MGKEKADDEEKGEEGRGLPKSQEGDAAGGAAATTEEMDRGAGEEEEGRGDGRGER